MSGADRSQPVVIVAPDSFKGTLTAAEVADGIARGLRAGGVRRVRVLPIADGGEGTLAVLVAPLGAALRTARVSDPLGRPLAAAYALSAERRVAIVEAAAAAGLGLIAPDERDPWGASSAGVGELILAARDAGAAEIVVALGGSATTDGGAGALATIAAAGGLGSARLVLLCDVTTPFELAAEVFGPQKGADPAMVARLSRRLARQAGGLLRDPRGVPMTGAAGGLAGGLWAELGARLVPGAAYVLERLRFDRLLQTARAVITGEGRLDAQTRAGKALSTVARQAAAVAVPVHAIVGCNALAPEAWRLLGLHSVVEASTPAELTDAGFELAGRLLAQP